MLKSFSLFCILFLSIGASGQMGDFISLKKKNNRHVATYMKGSRMEFQRVNGQQFNAIIEDIRHDSLFVRQWQIVSYMTRLGTSKVDTLGSLLVGMHYKEIFQIFPERKESWRFVKNGTIFMIGGLGYAALNVINAAYKKESLGDPENLRSLAIAGGIAAGGFLLNRIHHHRQKYGKGLKIEYVNMTK